MGRAAAALVAWVTLLRVGAQPGNGTGAPPIYYVHVPKCGSSFQTMVLLAGCPSVAPGDLAKTVKMNPDDIRKLPWFATKCRFASFELTCRRVR